MRNLSRRLGTVSVVLASVSLAVMSTGPVAAQSPAPSGGVVIAGVPITLDPAAAALLPEQYKASIRIVTSAPYPPFEMFDENQNLYGMDIDVGNMIAAKLGTTAVFESVDYNGVIPALQAGTYDMVLASMGDTPDREGALDFVNYMKQGQILLVPVGNPEGITGLESMCGKTLAVEAGNVTAEYFDEVTQYCAAHGQDNMELKELPKTSDALLAVKSGNASAQYLGVATAADLMTTAEGANYEIVTPADRPFGYLPRWVGAGIPKNAPELRDAVKAALTSLLADGTLTAVFDTYGQSRIVVDEIAVNKVVDEPLLGPLASPAP